MTNLLKQLSRYISLETASEFDVLPSVAQHLMERAAASAGRNPADAAQLREAARAYLSVVR